MFIYRGIILASKKFPKKEEFSMEDKESFETKEVVALVSGRQRPDNVYAFPVRNKKEVVCPKCGNPSFKTHCPDCGIPLKNAVYLEKIRSLFVLG